MLLEQDQWIVEGDRFLPQRYINLSLAINAKYNNLEIGMLRSENHINEKNKDHPFCLMEVFSDGSVKPIKYLQEREMDEGYLFWWLDKNGTAGKTGDQIFNEFLDEIKQAEAEQKKVRFEKTEEDADLLASIASSPLHTYRHNGNKIGSDNNYPTLAKKED